MTSWPQRSQIIHLCWIGLLSLSVWLFPVMFWGSTFSTLAVTVHEVPNPRQTHGGWVTDMANVISENAENKLNQMITDLEQNTRAEIAVVTVPDTSPSPTPKAFATELFNLWGIGKAQSNNGVLLLVAVEERRVEIETGTGLSQRLPDRQVQEILKHNIVPHLKQNRYDRGVLVGTQAIVKHLQGNPFSISTLPRPLMMLSAIAGCTGLIFFGVEAKRNRYRIPTHITLSQCITVFSLTFILYSPLIYVSIIRYPGSVLPSYLGYLLLLNAICGLSYDWTKSKQKSVWLKEKIIQFILLLIVWVLLNQGIGLKEPILTPDLIAYFRRVTQVLVNYIGLFKLTLIMTTFLGLVAAFPRHLLKSSRSRSSSHRSRGRNSSSSTSSSADYSSHSSSSDQSSSDSSSSDFGGGSSDGGGGGADF
ncbi:TPM domain-containing protein [Roseofilum capinflatum]|uniref:TPM domain-containing protein n=1 Tax=Roseofilum capinflatum BLCC-M114 TaxID=3022440 RepID=A0ABT7B0Q7_9CYAN|nr:TPM domain-containing protein [Roseofilum capinflatum]MDJ1172757.1 TPM domain-containing protein [Roseofilum capinflatum BLCC-M114]